MTDDPRKTPSGDDANAVTAFYDGGCPVCRTEIGHYQALSDRRPAAIAWRDLSADPDALAARGVDAAAAKRRFHAIDEHGALLSGVDAFIAVWRNLPVYRHLAGIVALPAVRPFAGLVYERGFVPALACLNARRARRCAGSVRPDAPDHPRKGETS